MERFGSRWEWRTFGNEFGKADARFAALESTHMQESDEIYLISPVMDKTVKIRGGLMDIKSLEQIDQAGLEQWRPVLKAEMPLSSDDVNSVRAALGTSAQVGDDRHYYLEDLLAELRDWQPGLRAVPVHKKRLRYTLGGCTGELTEVRAGARKSRTLAIESQESERVTSLVRELGLSDLPNTSYPRWLWATIGSES